jgi:hypothetical protein
LGYNGRDFRTRCAPLRYESSRLLFLLKTAINRPGFCIFLTTTTEPVRFNVIDGAAVPTFHLDKVIEAAKSNDFQASYFTLSTQFGHGCSPSLRVSDFAETREVEWFGRISPVGLEKLAYVVTGFSA